MGRTVVEVIGLALALAVVPVPAIAVILMLLSRSATRNSVAFLTGWLLGLTALATILLVVGGAGASGEDGSNLGASVRIVAGAALLLWGAKKWMSRPKDGEALAMPAWMSAIEDFGGAKSFSMGLLLAAANPKNIGLTFAAMATIATAGLATGREIVTMLVFVVVGSLTVLVPVAAYLLAGSRATPTLERVRRWLEANATTVMAVLFVVLGLFLLIDGISILR